MLAAESTYLQYREEDIFNYNFDDESDSDIYHFLFQAIISSRLMGTKLDAVK